MAYVNPIMQPAQHSNMHVFKYNEKPALLNPNDIQQFGAAFKQSKLAAQQLSAVFKLLPFDLDDSMAISFQHEYNDHIKIKAAIDLPDVHELSLQYRTASSFWYLSFGEFHITFQDAHNAAELLLDILESNYLGHNQAMHLQ